MHLLHLDCNLIHSFRHNASVWICILHVKSLRGKSKFFSVFDSSPKSSLPRNFRYSRALFFPKNIAERDFSFPSPSLLPGRALSLQKSIPGEPFSAKARFLDKPLKNSVLRGVICSHPSEMYHFKSPDEFHREEARLGVAGVVDW